MMSENNNNIIDSINNDNNNNTNNTINSQMVNFANMEVIPANKLNKGRKMVSWGNDNLYPNFLLDLYEEKGGTRHSMIVKKKVRYMGGQGINLEGIDPRLADFIESNDLDTEILKAIMDYEIFNGFSFEVIWSRDGQSIASIKHIPFSQLRIGIVDESLVDYFWYSKDWSQYKKHTPVAILKFDTSIPVGKQIVRYSEYNPKSTLYDYPTPEYMPAIYNIMTDFELNKYDYYNVKNGFFPSFMLTFRNGIPPIEEQDQFFREFKREHVGVEANQKILINYIDPAEQHLAPELTPITLNDSDTRFETMTRRVENNIIQGSGLSPQLLMLIEGQLGGTQDREALMNEFHKDYIAPRQKNIERVLNNALKVNNYSSKIELKKYNN